MYELATELRARLDEDTTTRRVLRTRDLRDLVAFAQVHSPYWRHRLAHLDPETVTAEHLAEIPPLGRDELRERWDDIVTVPDLRLHDALVHHRRHPGATWRGLRLFSTSGSSGEPLLIPLSEPERRHRDALATRWHIHRARRGWVPRRGRTALLWGRSPANLLDATHRERDSVEVLGPDDDPDRLRATLNQHEWFVLSGYASIVEEIAQWHLGGHVRLDIDTLIVGGEPMYPSMRRTVDRAWPGVTVLDRYGTTETGSLAHSDGEQPGMVLDDDQAIIEVVASAADDPVPGDGLLVTCLAQRTLPLFRYEVPDRVRLLPAQPTGPTRRIDHGPLRPEHLATIGATSVTAADVAGALAPLGLGPSQLVIDDQQVTLRLLAVQRPSASAAIDAITPVVGPVTIAVVDRLERDPVSEKLSPIVVRPHCSNPAPRQ